MKEVGNRIRFLRKKHNLTLKQFAEIIGISYGHLSNIENNKDIPSQSIIKLISYEFNVSIKWLEGDGNINNIEYSNVFLTEDKEFYKKILPAEMKKLYDAAEQDGKLMGLITTVIVNINYLMAGDCTFSQKLDIIEILGYYLSEFSAIMDKSKNHKFDELEYINLIDELYTELKDKRNIFKNV